MQRPLIVAALAGLALLLSSGAFAMDAAPATEEAGSLIATICELIDSSARAESLPVPFLTRLIWQESNFHRAAVSPAGARGVAQFMPGTASDRGLADPFDPEAAIPKAASLLAELKQRFGNLGLAAAAYNAGPTRLANWIANGGYLPLETEDYVSIVTRHPIDDWKGVPGPKMNEDVVFPDASCVQTVNKMRQAEPAQFANSPLLAPWGVQISGAFSKSAALNAYTRARSRYAAILADIDPMIIGGRLRSRGFRSFYRVRAPAQTRAEANALCGRILRAGGACVVLRS